MDLNHNNSHNNEANNPRPKRGGPKTPQGKLRSSLNALKHGRYARSFFVLRHEDHAAFERLVDKIARVLLPQNDLQYHLVRQLASVEWRLHRILSLDASLLDPKFDAADAAFSQHGLQPRPEIKLGAATHQILESSRLPHYLATRESQLLLDRSRILADFRHIRKGGIPSLPCSQIIDPMYVNPESSFQNELETNSLARLPQPPENTQRVDDFKLPGAA